MKRNTPNLTPKQLKILTIIRETRLTRGYSPTMQELADELDVSKVTVFEHVEALIKKGALIRDANKARSLEVAPNLRLPDEQRHTRLPLVGTIAAGAPIEAVEDREHLDLEEVFAPRRSAPNQFVLRVRGDSMIDEQIRDGDYVICEQRNTARNGQTVVALINEDEAHPQKVLPRKGRQDPPPTRQPQVRAPDLRRRGRPDSGHRHRGGKGVLIRGCGLLAQSNGRMSGVVSCPSCDPVLNQHLRRINLMSSPMTTGRVAEDFGVRAVRLQPAHDPAGSELPRSVAGR